MSSFNFHETVIKVYQKTREHPSLFLPEVLSDHFITMIIAIYIYLSSIYLLTRVHLMQIF